jgi:serine/threonine protein phosphatase PrpC
MALVVGVATDRGRVRESNEDNVAVLLPPQVRAGVDAVLAVADGMGGHQAGEVASRMALDYLEDAFAHRESARDVETARDLCPGLRDAIVGAHHAVREAADRDDRRRGMGTTLTAVAVAEGHLFLGHVGDSRAYLARGATLRQLSADDSWIAEQIRAGALSAAQARSHPGRNMLTQAVGSGEAIDVETASVELKAGDALVLCTDGLTNLVTDEEILDAVLSYGQPRVAAERLVGLANRRGSPDNVTAVVARVLDGADRAPSRQDTEQLYRPRWPRPPGWLAYLFAAVVAALAFLVLWASLAASLFPPLDWLRHLFAIGSNP